MLSLAVQVEDAPDVDAVTTADAGRLAVLRFELPDGSSLDLMLGWGAFVRTVARCAVVVAQEEAR